MANPLLRITTDTNKLTSLKKKLEKYPPAAIKAGLVAAEEYLNTDEFKMSMYPPESDEPFEWSSDKQRAAFFASDGFGRGIPTERTHELAQSGVFRVSEGNLWVEYENLAPYSNYVINPSMQIIGHRKRGWKPVNTFVVGRSKEIAKVFEKAAKAAWDNIERFMFGGGGGL
jgi:hypothetical protein